MGRVPLSGRNRAEEIPKLRKKDWKKLMGKGEDESKRETPRSREP
jgi:hypothetical protein